MLTTLLSLLGGGVMRALPELIGLWNKKTDNAHELDMLDKQFQLEQTRAAARMDEITMQGDIDQVLKLLDAQKSALEGQMQKTGIKVVDALNFLVRPLTTYYFLILYGLAKVAMFVLAMQAGISGWEAILKLYDANDRDILAGILAFWFVGRVFDKGRPQ
jgi:hypothetical protein